MSQEPGHQQVETELDRDIGMLGAVAIGVGTMIAAGIFVLSGLAVSKVGAAAIVSFLLAAVVAAFTARAENATVTPLHVVPAGAADARRERAETTLADCEGQLAGLDVSPELVESDDVVGAIVDRTGDHDLTIICATQEGLLQELVFGAIPEAVGQRAENTVIMSKRNLDITSKVRRWLRWE